MDRTTSRLERVRKRRQQHKTRNYLLIFAGVIGIFFALFVFKGLSFYSNIQTNKNPNIKVATKTPEEKSIYNMLLLGYGGGKHDGAYLTDTIMFLHLDTKLKKAILLSIPRDVWVKLPTDSGEDFHSKINSVYQMGLYPKEYPDVDTTYTKDGDDAGLIKHIMEQITGQKIDYYSTIDFQGFIKAIDILGGIEVDVDTTFDDYYYPVDGKEADTCGKKDQELEDAMKVATEDAKIAFPCRYEDLHFKKGLTKMNGETALKYARSRHALQDGGDFNRAKRQQKVMDAVKEKMLSVGFIPKIIPLMNELDDHIRTDLPLTELNKLLLELGKSKDYKVTKLVLTQETFLKSSMSRNGQYIIIPKAGLDDWTDVQKEIDFIRRGITPTPTPTETPIPTPTSKSQKLTGTPKPTKKVLPTDSQ